MAEVKAQIQLSTKEIYDMLCPKCKAKLKELIKARITDQMVSQVIG